MDLGPPGSFKQSFTGHVTLVCQVKSMALIATSIGSTITNVLNSAGNFFSQLSDLSWGSLLIGARAVRGLPAAALAGAVQRGAGGVPGVEVRWRDVWGAYMVGYGVNTVVPARRRQRWHSCS